MLKRKLQDKLTINPSPAANTSTEQNNKSNNDVSKNENMEQKSSPYFRPSYWEQFYALECDLNEAVSELTPPEEIAHTYNPIEYAAQIHCEYLKRFLNGPKKLIFIGMNPGPGGMSQTGVGNEEGRRLTVVMGASDASTLGSTCHNLYHQLLVPFGNIGTVRDIMQLHGMIVNPPQQHPRRPIKGLEFTTEEPSGKRLWTLLQKLSNNSLDIFAQQCFVHNFCPLAFFNRQGKNITPSELNGPYKMQLRDVCLNTIEQLLHLVQPNIIVAVGDYVYRTLTKSEYCKDKRLLRLDHPSPRPLNNTRWEQKAEFFLNDNELIKYLRNENDA